MRIVLWISTCVCFAACGPGGLETESGGGSGALGDNAHTTGGASGNAPSSCAQISACPIGGTVSGKVYAPNGTDPIAGASVYVPTTTEEFPAGVSCDLCNHGFPACASVTTASDGSFTLTGVPAGATEIDIQKGRFRRKLHLDISCGAATLTSEQTRLPRNPSEGDIPKIAVANGEWDKLECVLRKIGLDDSAIDIYNHSDSFDEAGKPQFSELISNMSLLASYNVVFVNCSDNVLENYLSDPQTLSNLKNYVAGGGRLYVTDWSYDHIEQVPDWAPLVCWQDGPGASCGQAPEPMHGAAIGANGLTVEATIEDQGLARWLSQLGAMGPNGTVHLTHFLVQWVMQHSTQAPMVKEWVRGPVRSEDGRVRGSLPLTFTFDYNSCGRVLYSSYHTLGRDTDTCGNGNVPQPCFATADCPPGQTCEGTPLGMCTGPSGASSCHFPDYCDAGSLSPQERILEYLIFEISTCIGPPG